MKSSPTVLALLFALLLGLCTALPAFGEQLVNAGFCPAEKPALQSSAFKVEHPSDTHVCFYLEPTDTLAANCNLSWKVMDTKTDTPVLSGTTQLNTASALGVCSRSPLPAGTFELHGQCVQMHTPNFCVRGVIAR